MTCLSPGRYSIGATQPLPSAHGGSERKFRILEEEEARDGTTLAFTEYGQPLAMVSSFRYLGGTLTATDSNWPTVVGDLRKSC